MSKVRAIISAYLRWFYFSGNESGATKASQQSVHWTLGILAHFQEFFWLRVFPALKQSPRPPQRQ
jgi:hypothetical protein